MTATRNLVEAPIRAALEPRRRELGLKQEDVAKHLGGIRQTYARKDSMFTDIVAASGNAIRRTRRKPMLGQILASNQQSTTRQPDLLDALDDLQRAYVTPVINRIVDTAEHHLSGTPLDTTTRAVVSTLDTFQREQVDPLIDQAMATSAALLQNHVLSLLPDRIRSLSIEHLPVLGDTRQHHARLLAGDNHIPEEITPEERSLQRQLAVTLTTFGVASGAALFYPPLMILSVPGLLYIMGNMVTAGYRQFVDERRIGLMAQVSVIVIATLGIGELWVLSLYCLFFVPTSLLIYKTRRRSRQRLVNILGETPRFVWVAHKGSEMRVPFERLQVGDVVVVATGEMIPIDGTIIAGMASIDQHMLTGEAQPVEKGSGDVVYAATIVLTGYIHIRVEQAGTTTVAAQVGAVLNQTADYHPTAELRGLHLAETMALPLLLLGGVTLSLLGPVSAVALITCAIGYHVRLGGPISILNYLHIAADYGILVKDGHALETLAEVDTVVFDKTGTLTHERPHVGTVHPMSRFDEQTVLALAAAAESRQSHPIAQALLHETHTRQLVIPTIDEDEAAYMPGYGLRVQLQDGRMVHVGSARFMDSEGIEIPVTVQAVQETCHEQGHLLVYVAVDDILAGAIELHTSIRPEAAQVVAALHARNIGVAIISGDQPQPTLKLAQHLGIDHAFAEVLPQEKASLVAQLQREGRMVCFVGDGINDAIALKQAQVSISLRGATTIATDTAQVVLMDRSLQQLPLLLDLAHQLRQNMRGNVLAATLPGTINIASVYLLHTGVLAANLLAGTGMIGNVVNAMVPLVQHAQHTPLALSEAQETDEASSWVSSRSSVPERR